MAGVIFIILFGLFVLPPFYLIGKLDLTDSQKLGYRLAAFALPICSGMFTYHSNILSNNIDTWTQFDKVFAWAVIILVSFGSWIVFIIACFKEK
ncbi:MAG TPA: hypothetical protein PLR90_01445 [Methylophilus sp.]|nr:hypothetical protein [Methylophilus sp.]HQQ32556.1 hypothetical protein [Methylophilus sp.]